MNVPGDVDNHVEDAIRTASISVVWPNARRDAEIFVWNALTIAIQNVFTQNVTENAMNHVPEYHAINLAKKYLLVDVNVLGFVEKNVRIYVEYLIMGQIRMFLKYFSEKKMNLMLNSMSWSVQANTVSK